jgi:ferrous iron transport protein A
MSLAAVPFAKPMRVTRIRATGPIAIRLMEMGLIAGAEVQLVGRAPLGDPLRIRLDDSSLSLRHEEADLIDVAPAAG